MQHSKKNNKSVVEKHYSYDLSELIQLSNGSNDFVANMIEIFIRNANEIMANLKESLLENDWTKISSLAHKAAPSFHFMGMVLFSEKLKFIEINAAIDKEHDRIAEMIGLINKNMVVIFADLRKDLQKFKK